MNQVEVSRLLVGLGAVITNSHLIYTSGRHGSAYVNKDAIYPHTAAISQLCRDIAEYFMHSDEVEVVVAPAVGGVIMSQWVAHHLTYWWVQATIRHDEILSVYAEKSDDGRAFVLKRGYDALVKGKRVLVVEDVLTTGGSVRKVVEAVRQCGGEVVGVGAICNRGNITTHDLGDVPQLFSLVNISLESWSEAECPLCRDNVPINTTVGKGSDFLARRQG